MYCAANVVTLLLHFFFYDGTKTWCFCTECYSHVMFRSQPISALYCDVKQKRKSLFKQASGDKRYKHFENFFFLVLSTLPAKKIRSAPVDHWWTPFEFHDCFYGQWDLWCRPYHQQLVNSSWKSLESIWHRIAALHTKITLQCST